MNFSTPLFSLFLVSETFSFFHFFHAFWQSTIFLLSSFGFVIRPHRNFFILFPLSPYFYLSTVPFSLSPFSHILLGLNTNTSLSSSFLLFSHTSSSSLLNLYTIFVSWCPKQFRRFSFEQLASDGRILYSLTRTPLKSTAKTMSKISLPFSLLSDNYALDIEGKYTIRN